MNDDLDNLISGLDEHDNAKERRSGLGQKDIRPHTANENDDEFSRGVKANLTGADELIAKGARVAVPTKVTPKRAPSLPPKSAQGLSRGPDNADDEKELEIDDILNSLEAKDKRKEKAPQSPKPEPAPVPPAKTEAVFEKPGQEEQKRAEELRKRKQALFSLKSTPPKQEESVATPPKPNPYLDVGLAQQEERKVSPENNGRVKTPIVFPMTEQPPDAVPQTVTAFGMDDIIIAPEKSRRKTRMLSRPGTTVRPESAGHPPLESTTSVIVGGPDDNFKRVPGMSKTDMSGAREAAMQQPDPLRFSGELGRRSASSERKEEGGLAPRREESLSSVPGNLLGLPRFAEREAFQRSATIQPILEAKEPAATPTLAQKAFSATAQPGGFGPVGSMPTTAPALAKKPIFLMDDEPDVRSKVPQATVEQPKPKSGETLLPAFLAPAPMEIIVATVPIKPPSPAGQQKPPQLSLIREETKEDAAKLAEFERIEVTGNMNRHQVADLNAKIHDMTQNMTKLLEENQQLVARNKQLELEQEKATAGLREEVDRLTKELEGFKEAHRKELLQVKEEYNKQLQDLQDLQQKRTQTYEEEKKQLAESETKTKQREIERMQEMHKADLDAMERRYSQTLEAHKRESELKIAALKEQLSKQADITKITTQVDTIVDRLSTKMEQELQTRNRELTDREQAAAAEKGRTEVGSGKLAIERKRLDDLQHALATKEKQLAIDTDEAKKLYQYKKETLETQYDKKAKELATKEEMLIGDRKQFETEKARYEKERTEWEVTYKDQKGSLALETSLVEKAKIDLKQQMEENSAYPPRTNIGS